jgi:hypothetical protein
MNVFLQPVGGGILTTGPKYVNEVIVMRCRRQEVGKPPVPVVPTDSGDLTAETPSTRRKEFSTKYSELCGREKKSVHASRTSARTGWPYR